MDLSNSRLSRNLFLSNLIKQLFALKGLSISQAAEVLETNKTSVAVLVRHNRLETLKSETFIRFLHKLGVKMVFTADCYHKPFTFNGGFHELVYWVEKVIRNYMVANKLSLKKVSVIVGESYRSTSGYLSGNSGRSCAPLNAIELFSRLGIAFNLEMEHPDIDIKQLDKEGKVELTFIEALIEDGKKLKTDETFLGNLSDEQISRMGRGLVKTSMGEVVRPFL